jgi:hypothetical protein
MSESLIYAGCSYLDRTIPLEMGMVVPEGINLTFVSFPSPGDLFRRQSRFRAGRAAGSSRTS